MNILASIFLLSIFVTYINCWVGIITYNPEDFRKNNITDAHCFTTSHGRFKEREVKRLENSCAIATCSKDRSIKLTGCGSIGIAPPCYVGRGNLSKPFPDCCFEIICPPKDLNRNNL